MIVPSRPHAPARSIPSESIPARSIPSESIPARSIPSESILKRSIPAGAVPAGLMLTVLVLATLLPATPLPAHQLKEAVTRVLFNPRTGNIEVMHRFILHDAEHATRKLFGGEVDLLGSAAARDQFESYVNEQFSMSDQDGTSMDLKPVGNEIEGRYLWVYAEAPIPEGLTALTLSHDALRDVWPDQVNLVNVERDKKVRSATFDQGRREATIHF